ALGAVRTRLARQLLTESLLLSFLGGIVGVGFAYTAVATLRASLTTTVPQPNPLSVGLVPLLFTFGACLFVGLLFGLAPVLQAAGIGASEALKARSDSSANLSGQWLRDGLVVAEIALSLALLVGAGLLLRTFINLRATDVGVRGEHVLTATVRLPPSKYEKFD